MQVPGLGGGGGGEAAEANLDTANNLKPGGRKHLVGGGSMGMMIILQSHRSVAGKGQHWSLVDTIIAPSR